MSAHHEHYLRTEGMFSPGWLEPVDSSIEGQQVWRFPYVLELNGQTYQRALEVSEKVETGAHASPTADFVGRLATGWLVTVARQESGYSIHLALESADTTARDTVVVTEAEHITEIAAAQSQEQFVAAA